MTSDIGEVEKWAQRLAGEAQEAFLGEDPEANVQILTAALCMAAGWLMVKHCPPEDQPEGASILVEFIRRAVLVEQPAPENPGAGRPN